MAGRPSLGLILDEVRGNVKAENDLKTPSLALAKLGVLLKIYPVGV